MTHSQDSGPVKAPGPWRVLLSLSLLLVAVVRANAHDLERTTVHLRIAPDGSYALRLAHDPSWLLLRMETFAGGPQTATTDPAARDARLRALAPQMIDRVVLFVDGHEVRPTSAEYAPPPERVPPGEFALASYTLRGRLPASARALRWYYGLVADPYPFTIELADGSSRTELVRGDAWSTSLPLGGPFATPSVLARIRTYVALGYTTVLPRGREHVLFVMAFFLLGTGLRAVLIQAAAFTVAHSLTLGLSMHGLLMIPDRIVQPIVAVSVVFVAVENLRTRTLTPVRILSLLLFGLFHGMALGRAAATPSAEPSQSAVAWLGVNAGVELAQLSVIGVLASIVGGWQARVWYYRRVVVPASLAMATVGVYWTALRLIIR